MNVDDQGRLHTESARRAMESASPPSMLLIDRLASRRIRLRKVRTALLAGSAAIAISSIALVLGPLNDEATPANSGSTLPTTTVDLHGASTLPSTVTSNAEPPTEQLPYLGLHLPGWEFVRAAEGSPNCLEPVDQPVQETSRQATYAFGASGIGSNSASGVRMININVQPGSGTCGLDEFPADASELGPPASPPHVNDHGIITVMGHRARVVDEDGIYRVLWLLDEQGSVASIDVFPGDSALSLSEVIAIAEGIVELTPEEWTALLQASSDAPTTSLP